MQHKDSCMARMEKGIVIYRGNTVDRLAKIVIPVNLEVSDRERRTWNST